MQSLKASRHGTARLILEISVPGISRPDNHPSYPRSLLITQQSHDRTAFEILVREHSPMLLAFIRALVRDSVAVEDVHQETLITAWKTLDRFDRERPFAPWLRGIARNHVLAHYRKTRRLPIHCEETVIDHLDRRLDQISRRTGDTWEEKLEALDHCLQAIPAPNRTLLDLHYREELDTERIALRTDLRRETVKKRLQRIRAVLAECLQRKGVLDRIALD